jgi:hypothetical protein
MIVDINSRIATNTIIAVYMCVLFELNRFPKVVSVSARKYCEAFWARIHYSRAAHPLRRFVLFSTAFFFGDHFRNTRFAAERFRPYQTIPSISSTSRLRRHTDEASRQTTPLQGDARTFFCKRG